jgi:uncharacterized protein (TIGR02757 family)
MDATLKKKLQKLADKYEVASFCDEDPSQFLRWYQPEAGRGTVADVEVASFIAAMLAFGNRKQFIPKVRLVLETSDRSLGSVSEWLMSGAYKKDFPRGAAKFYRFYAYDDMQTFFGELADILKKHDSLGEYIHTVVECDEVAYRNHRSTQTCGFDTASDKAYSTTGYLATILSAAFPHSSIVPKGRTSANKRIHMFLRWMVRRNSPVDLGLWQWADPATLLIPLDTHVMQEAAKLGLIPTAASASRKTAELLTASLNEAFPGDPCRGDFALFGLGVDVI